MRKLEGLDLTEKANIFAPLTTQFNTYSQKFSSLRDDEINEKESEAQADLARAMVKIGAEMLSDPKDRFRYQNYVDACNVLGMLGTYAEPAIPTLVGILHYAGHQGVRATDYETPVSVVHDAAIAALMKLGNAAIPAIEKDLEREHPAGEFNPLAAEGVLLVIGTPEAKSLLERRRAKRQEARQQAQEVAKAEQKTAEDDFQAQLKAAMKGDAVAQNNVGVAYGEGVGTKRDLEQSFKWLAKAAVQGQPDAEGNLFLLLRDEIKTKMLAEDVKRGKQALPFFAPIPMAMGKAYYREMPLWVFVDAGWEFSSNYVKREYVGKLLAIVRRYPLKIDAITVRRWDDNNHVRELTYTETPWKRVIFGDTLKTTMAESIAPNLPQGMKPEAPPEGNLTDDAP